MAFPLFCEKQGKPKSSPTASKHKTYLFLSLFCWIWKIVPGLLMVLICDKAIFCCLDSSGSHKIAKHFLRAGKGWRAFKNRRQRVWFLSILQMIRFFYILMVKMIVAQISGRHLFEHWKAAHNFHWQEKVKLFNTDAANVWEQINNMLENYGLTVEELKNDLLLSALTELLWTRLYSGNVHCVNHNFENYT